MERADGLFFFPLLTNEERPQLPLLTDPPAQARMRTWAAGRYLRRGHRGCGSAPNSGLREASGPRNRQHSLSTTHQSRNHGGSGGSVG